MGLTRDEWFAGVDFLTRVGQMCDDRRQEVILLSDVLGVSMLVEMTSRAAAPGTTEPTVFGPFHVEGAPPRPLGSTVVDRDVGGEPLTVHGTVRDAAGAAVAGACLDVWQTAPNGLYDVQDDGQPAMNLRGVFTTGDDGRYVFDTVRPAVYLIPSDGPVGELLRATGRHNWRPGHIHFLITAPGQRAADHPRVRPGERLPRLRRRVRGAAIADPRHGRRRGPVRPGARPRRQERDPVQVVDLDRGDRGRLQPAERVGRGQGAERQLRQPLDVGHPDLERPVGAVGEARRGHLQPGDQVRLAEEVAGGRRLPSP